jgi:hypothetical protein
MSVNVPFIAVGKASANALNKANLGKMIISNGKMYVLCKNTTLLAAAAKKGLVSAFSAGVPTWNVDLPADATGAPFVIIPAGQVGSDGSTSLLAGDYFLGQISGPFTGLSANTLVRTGAAQNGLFVNSLGRIVAYIAITSTTVSTVAHTKNTSYITNTAVCTAGDDQTGVLAGLV